MGEGAFNIGFSQISSFFLLHIRLHSSCGTGSRRSIEVVADNILTRGDVRGAGISCVGYIHNLYLDDTESL